MMSAAKIREGYDADFIVLDKDLELVATFLVRSKTIWSLMVKKRFNYESLAFAKLKIECIP